jgi:hypothetical protein
VNCSGGNAYSSSATFSACTAERYARLDGARRRPPKQSHGSSMWSTVEMTTRAAASIVAAVNRTQGVVVPV